MQNLSSRTDSAVRYVVSLQPLSDSKNSLERSSQTARKTLRRSARASEYNVSATGTASNTQAHIPSYSHHRRSRRKNHDAWEIADRDSGGKYSANLSVLISRFKGLSPAELRVAAMVMAMLKNHEIAEKLRIDFRTVDNHRSNIRRKLGLTEGSLFCHLVGN